MYSSGNGVFFLIIGSSGSAISNQRLPLPPNLLSATLIGTEAVVSWTQVSGRKPTSYSIRYCFPCYNCTTEKRIKRISPTKEMYKIQLPTLVTCYELTIRSCIADRCGTFSTPLFIRPRAYKSTLHIICLLFLGFNHVTFWLKFNFRFPDGGQEK